MNKFFMSQIGKSLAIAILVVVLLIIGNNLYQAQVSKAQKSVNTAVTDRAQPVQLTLAIIDISGFDCPTCPIGAEYALKDLKGVYDARVTASGEGSKVLYDTNKVMIEDFKKTLDPFTIEVVSQEPASSSKLN